MRDEEIWTKTGGVCHLCGDSIDLHSRGYRAGRADGYWEIDHIRQRAKGGSSAIENCLPACTTCNRLRWHRTGDQFRELLVWGLVARQEVKKLSETGSSSCGSLIPEHGLMQGVHRHAERPQRTQSLRRRSAKPASVNSLSCSVSSRGDDSAPAS